MEHKLSKRTLKTDQSMENGLAAARSARIDATERLRDANQWVHEMAVECIQAGYSEASVAREAGISITSLRKWLGK